MESKAIEVLLEKYLKAETSVKEEERLRTYFASGEVPHNLQQFTPMFSYFNLAKEENFTGKVTYTSGSKKVYSWMAVAASILILLGVVVQQNTTGNEFGTYEDPKLAMQETKEVLEMVSRYMNTGADDLGYLEEFNSAKNKIIKNP
jgi:hypothetical protein